MINGIPKTNNTILLPDIGFSLEAEDASANDAFLFILIFLIFAILFVIFIIGPISFHTILFRLSRKFLQHKLTLF